MKAKNNARFKKEVALIRSGCAGSFVGFAVGYA
jgi:hypothetical protein